jgi:hypothetical protein
MWLRRLDDYTSNIESRVQELQREAEAADLLPRTRQRLLRIADGFARQVEAVASLFEPLDAGTDEMVASAIPSRPEPGQLAILECYEHLFRDWVWGERESALTLDFVKPLVPAGLERVAVFGAGAGRLAVDVHQTCGPAQTLAFDVNPLPLLIGDKLLAGETIDLPEFPIDPNSDEVAVVARSLVRPFVVRDGFSFVFADALRPPIPRGIARRGGDAVVHRRRARRSPPDGRRDQPCAAPGRSVGEHRAVAVSVSAVARVHDRGNARDRRGERVRAAVA